VNASARKVGLIVGSGFAADDWPECRAATLDTPYGPASSPMLELTLGGRPVLCLARHGIGHLYAPHEVNYRANIWALREHGVTDCIGLNLVGGIAASLTPGELAVPDQLIDYTSGRESSFGSFGDVVHVELTEPFSPALCHRISAAIVQEGLLAHGGTYGVTQGPRLETRAEIDRLERDGCAMVGMTAMPEAALAREAGLDYAVLAGVVNYAAGRSPHGASLHREMRETVGIVMERSKRVVTTLLSTWEDAVL
jgi:purine nucleoside phosphorylase